MSLRIKREGATPNLLKYSIVADHTGGEAVLHLDDLRRDAIRGPLRNYVERAPNMRSDEEACRFLLCNASMRVFLTAQTLARVAVDAHVRDGASELQLSAEPGAKAILALEFRHSVSA